MKKKISKKYLILSISAFLSVITSIVLACSGDGFFQDYYNSFFAPETSKTSELKPFYRSMQFFYNDPSFYEGIHVMDSANIIEWKQFFNEKVAFDDLSYIVYKSRIGEIDTCIFNLKNKAIVLNNKLKNNSLLMFDNKVILKEFLFYQGFAKRCEPFANYIPDKWNDDKKNDPRNDTIAMQKLILGGQKAFLSVSSEFIKQRYLYQIIRLYFQAGNYEKSILFYNNNKQLFISNNINYYRTLGYIAASNYKLRNFSHANYFYSIIFDNCDLLKKSSFLSFHPQNENDWNEALLLCQNTKEKEVLWQMLGIYVDPIRAMEEIYKLNPQSKYLDLLLVRAVNINEESFLNYRDYTKGSDSSYAFLPQKVNLNLLNFIQKAANSNITYKPYLWHLASGYLNLIIGNFKQAEIYFSKAESFTFNDTLISEQIKSFRIISKIELLSKPNSKFEDEITQDLIWLAKEKHHEALRSSSIYVWALCRLSEKYNISGEYIKAQCLDNLNRNYFYQNEKKVNEMIAFLDKPSKTNFEKYIINIYPYSKSALYNYKAINLIYKYKFKEALVTLDSGTDAGKGVLLANPFVIHINDCHDCDFKAFKKTEYTQYSFVKQLIDLEVNARVDYKNAPQYYFLIANGLYNMTYFGNSHSVFDSPIINLRVGYLYWGQDTVEINTNHSLFDCRKAMEYYLKAKSLSTDKEFKAKCCFMAAKCEQNQYFISPLFSYNESIKSGIYYKELYYIYSKTQYYKDIIKECGYFKKYVASK